MSNINNARAVTLLSILSSKAFRIGATENRQGLPLRHYADGGDQFRYEWGRLYAAAGGPLPIKQGRRVSFEAQLFAATHRTDVFPPKYQGATS